MCWRMHKRDRVLLQRLPTHTRGTLRTICIPSTISHGLYRCRGAPFGCMMAILGGRGAYLCRIFRTVRAYFPVLMLTLVAFPIYCVAVCCSVLQCVAVCWSVSWRVPSSVLQCVAECCSVSWHVPSTVFQCVAVCCSI